MNKHDAVKKIIEAAKRDTKKRKDIRYIQTMGFLIAKGLY